MCNAERREACIVEVKGPTDHLSHQQRAWLRLMADSAMDAFVVKVLPPAAAAAKGKGRGGRGGKAG